MMKTITLISFMMLALVHNLFGGDWSVGFTASPILTIPRASFDLPSPRSRFDYSFGALAIQDNNSSVFASVGLQYSHKSVLLQRGIPDTRAAMDPGTGRIDMSRVVYADYAQTYHSVDLSLSLCYKVIQRGTYSLFLSAGADAGYLFQQRTILDPTSTGEIVLKSSEHTLIAGVQAGFGIRYYISSTVSLLVVPTYSYSAYPIPKIESLKFQSLFVEFALLFQV